MEFYGSEATILTSISPQSILLLKIHKTHIARHHRSIFISFIICQMFMIDAHWFMDTYIARLSLIIYYHALFYSMRHGATIVTSYCPIMMSDTIVPPE